MRTFKSRLEENRKKQSGTRKGREYDIYQSWWQRNKPIFKLRIISFGFLIFFGIPWLVGMVVCLLFLVHSLLSL